MKRERAQIAKLALITSEPADLPRTLISLQIESSLNLDSDVSLNLYIIRVVDCLCDLVMSFWWSFEMYTKLVKTLNCVEDLLIYINRDCSKI